MTPPGDGRPGAVDHLQGTVAAFDPDRRDGSAVLDDGTRIPFPAAAFEASGLRMLRPGQRIRLERDRDAVVLRVTLITMP